MLEQEQIIEEARKILDNSFFIGRKVFTFASSQTILYYAHCKEQIRNAMIRMLESNGLFYQFTYSCLGNQDTYEAKNKKSIPNKENDESWNNYFINDYSLIVKPREISFDYLYQRIVNDCNSGVFLWFNEYNLMELFENNNKLNAKMK